MSKTLLLTHIPGQTITVDVLSENDDTVQGSAARALAEDTNGSGWYRADLSDLDPGKYRLSAAAGSVVGYVNIDQADGIFHAQVDRPVTISVALTVPRLLAASANQGTPSGLRPNSANQGRQDFFRDTAWSLELQDIGVIAAGQQIVFTMKTDINNDDDAADLQLYYDIDAQTTTVRIVNGNAAAPTDEATGTLESYIEESVTKWKLTLVLDDALVSQLTEGQYFYDFKEVGTNPGVMDYGTLILEQPTTRSTGVFSG